MMPPRFLLLGLTAVLTACTGPAAPTAVSGVQVRGDTTLAIGQSATLTATVTGAGGTVLTGQTVTWSSSDPALVAVDATGTVTARHFSPDAANKTVTITASAGGKSGTLSVLPYGFDVACGTYTISTSPAPDIAVYTRFRNADGSPIAADTDYAVTGPASFNGGKPYTGRVFQGSSAGGAYGGAPAVTGTYRATITVAGTAYSDTCTVDAAKVLGFVTTPSLTVSAGKVSYSGTAPTDARAVSAVVTADLLQGTPNYGTVGTVLSTPAFSLVSDLTATPPSGTYQGWIFARTYSNALPMSDTVLISATAAGSVTLP